ncbi:MAG: molybdenum cofactor guanylyltransferase, partial [Bacteroidetes bacterium]|nr:molybdenum cofactor guanylyltransferase [Bacteroidota bacterium]
MPLEKYNNITSVILAGGKNSRYNGSPKALLEIDGETLYKTAVDKLGKIFNTVVLITNTPEIFPDDACLKYCDIIKNIGPLGGIHSALVNIHNQEAIFVTAADMPFLNDKIIRTIVNSYIAQNP